MNPKELVGLVEAYMEVYNEGDVDSPYDRAQTNRADAYGRSQTNRADAYGRSQKKKKENPQKEQVDLYDIILSHLLDEGYADTQEGAEVIMVNMSEDWREEVIEKFISPFKGKVSYNNPQGLSPAMKASHRSDDLQRTEPGSKRQKKQTQRSQQLDRMYHSARTSHLP
jgi:hypothetical protein